MASNQRFVVTLCTLTVRDPVEGRIVEQSPSKYVFLTPPSVNGTQLLECDNRPALVSVRSSPVVKQLIDDMGGHPRAIEALFDAIADTDNTEQLSYQTLVSDVIQVLVQKYPIWRKLAPKVHTLLSGVLCGTTYERDAIVDGYSIDSWEAMGLVRVQDDGRVIMPFIIIMLMAKYCRWLDGVFMDGYQEADNNLANKDHLSGMRLWQPYEAFCCSFQALRERTLAHTSDRTNFRVLHHGAHFKTSSTEDPVVSLSKVKEHLLASKHTNTSELEVVVRTNKSNITAPFLRHVVQNAPGAPYGDAFTDVQIADSQKTIRSVTQVKLINGSLTDALYTAERKKAMGGLEQGTSSFAMVSVAESKISDHVMGNLDFVVHKDNARDYFGPYVGRAFWLANELENKTLDLNTATRLSLTAVAGIGPQLANALIGARPLPSWEAVAALKGMGPIKLEELKRHFTLGKSKCYRIARCVIFIRSAVCPNNRRT